MTYDEFVESLTHANPPQQLSPELKALWYDGKEDWESSHNIAQDVENTNGSWIHAYLHRKEGDISNARYWYSRAGKAEHRGTLKEEWESLVRNFIR